MSGDEDQFLNFCSTVEVVHFEDQGKTIHQRGEETCIGWFKTKKRINKVKNLCLCEPLK